MLIWLLPLLGLTLHLAYVRYSLPDAESEWEDLVEGSWRNGLRSLRDEIELTALMADETYAASLAARASSSTEAVRLLDLTCDVLVAAGQSRLTRLQALGRCVRMASAVMPVPPLLPRHFELPQLATLAGLSHAFQSILVTTGERLRVRVLVLRLGFRLVLRHVCVARVEAGREQQSAWSAFGAGLADFKTLDERHVEALGALLAGLSLALEPNIEGGSVR